MLTVITGAPGSGKTCAAVYFAHLYLDKDLVTVFEYTDALHDFLSSKVLSGQNLLGIPNLTERASVIILDIGPLNDSQLHRARMWADTAHVVIVVPQARDGRFNTQAERLADTVYQTGCDGDKVLLTTVKHRNDHSKEQFWVPLLNNALTPQMTKMGLLLSTE